MGEEDSRQLREDLCNHEKNFPNARDRRPLVETVTRAVSSVASEKLESVTPESVLNAVDRGVKSVAETESGRVSYWVSCLLRWQCGVLLWAVGSFCGLPSLDLLVFFFGERSYCSRQNDYSTFCGLPFLDLLVSFLEKEAIFQGRKIILLLGELNIIMSILIASLALHETEKGLVRVDTVFARVSRLMALVGRPGKGRNADRVTSLWTNADS